MAGTLLASRSTFLTKAQAMQLLYAACTPSRARFSAQQAGSDALRAVLLPPPALCKPQLLWTGKQVRPVLSV